MSNGFEGGALADVLTLTRGTLWQSGVGPSGVGPVSRTGFHQVEESVALGPSVSGGLMWRRFCTAFMGLVKTWCWPGGADPVLVDLGVGLTSGIDSALDSMEWTLSRVRCKSLCPSCFLAHVVATPKGCCQSTPPTWVMISRSVSKHSW